MTGAGECVSRSPTAGRDLWRTELVGVRVPDTSAARAALLLIRRYADSMLYGHSVRSFVFASEAIRKPGCAASVLIADGLLARINKAPFQDDV